MEQRDALPIAARRELLKKRFYYCPNCHNVVYVQREADISCCGETLEALSATAVYDMDALEVEWIENELYVHIEHPMQKDDYIAFLAYVSDQRLQLVHLYPEQSAEARFQRTGHAFLYHFSEKDGLVLHLNLKNRAEES